MAKPEFSIFPAGHLNMSGVPVLSNHPDGAVSILDVRDYIVSDEPKNATSLLQGITDHKEAQKFKILNFKYVTFGGTFKYRNSQSLIQKSGMFVLDVDGLKTKEEVACVRDIFIKDTRVESNLVFTSPSGLGVKAVVTLQPYWGETLKEQFKYLSHYFLFEYGISLDQSGSDICRPCYLPYDPECFINPKFAK